MDFFKNRVITKGDWVIIGGALFLLILISAAYFLMLNVVKGEIEQVRVEISKTQGELNEARLIAAKRDGLIKEIEQVKQKISNFEDKLPTDKEIPRLLSQFQQIAELNGMKYMSINAEPMDEKELYVRIPFKVRVNGGYPVIGEFLRSLEFGNRFIKVEDLDIGPQDKGSSEASFVISTYMFVTKEKTGESGVTQS
ncbi:MAG: hypothetical protein C4532_19435 [Candidatus Abyssobacteria bacterium SURF_17]|jgi:Tfp pilus assembly protein PilO|uniref:Pilus assembly protein PilO n=1 Tax=Candidatus Abyssobacteria bacterium SURF_17 TaxID=2093361 RepID=A0A419ENL4_9BACT|nr:MAG: hypothetical protein C4532_19435 [Candidatus Abyssubacteria bacterium SURF_17]